LSLHDLRFAFVGEAVSQTVLAYDLARWPVPTVTPDDNLHTALRAYAQRQIEEIPVVNPDDPKMVICMLHRSEVIAAYDRQMAALRSQQPSDDYS
jgi:CIC family chloride channel protein